MAFQIVLLVFIAFSLTLGNVNGVQESKSISKKEELELDRQLKLLNKPAVKTIRTDEGAIFNCVDINKQPAFDHPLLKNHTIQMRPSSLPKGFIKGASSLTKPLQFGLTNEGCPPGTVPIQMIQREGLINAKSLSKRYSQKDSFTGYHFATVKMTGDAFIKYYGASAYLSIHNPNVTTDQFSEGVLWVENGLESQLNSIQVGWTVNPKLFQDNRPRFFSYWTADGYHKTGCFNLLCPGFVQVSSIYHMGQELLYSVYRGDQRVLPILVFQDPKTGNWWLGLASVSKFYPIGYWPKSIFTSLANSASVIEWGGEVYSPTNEDKPPMGSGHFSSGKYTETAYVSRILVMDESRSLVYPEESRMQIVANDPKCYFAKYDGYQGSKGYMIIYGGPIGLGCNG